MALTPTKKRSKRGRFIVLGVVVALLVVCGGGIALLVANNGGDEATPAQPATENGQDGQEDAMPGIGDEARDGLFAFTVTDVETGATEVGDEFFNESAQGEFAIVHLAVENIGDVPKPFMDDEQRLFTADGNEYSADTAADLYLNEDGSALYEEINPGNKIDVQIAFDVPEGAELSTIELHDSFLSDGVTVALK
ncbi:DUF4352 domain-containing protein [Phytomonospora sp. NPDC050363]|uniref:DUF4352 domain-containing protein n=1 Tax=Phytomonospora sp. NPDC050363 TaxID=3155642 RepID=UPI00340DD939